MPSGQIIAAECLEEKAESGMIDSNCEGLLNFVLAVSLGVKNCHDNKVVDICADDIS